jgi:hypothetical protein
MAYQKCYGKYVANDPCYPSCSTPDGSGCDYAPLSQTEGSNPWGLTGKPYSVTYSDQGKLTGNFDTRVYVPTIDPYQVQVPPTNSFSGFMSARQYLGFYGDTQPQCAFARATGTPESITQDGSTTELTAVPRYSTKDFFAEGEMDKLSPKPSGGGREAWKHSYKCACGKWCVVEGSMTMTTAEVKEQCTQSGGGCEKQCPSSFYQNPRK